MNSWGQGSEVYLFIFLFWGHLINWIGWQKFKIFKIFSPYLLCEFSEQATKLLFPIFGGLHIEEQDTQTAPRSLWILKLFLNLEDENKNMNNFFFNFSTIHICYSNKLQEAIPIIFKSQEISTYLLSIILRSIQRLRHLWLLKREDSSDYYTREYSKDCKRSLHRKLPYVLSW